MKKVPVIVLGGGGHAKVLIDMLRLNSVRILGIADSNSAKIAVPKLKVLGNDKAVLKFSKTKIRLVNGVGSVRIPEVRKRLFENFKKRGYHFISVIHPSAVIAKDVEIGEGAQVMAGAVIQPGSSIGANTIINTRASIDHDCVIGPHVHIAPGVTLSGGVTVGAGSHIGTGAVIVQGVTLPPNSFVKAGSLVK